MTVSGEADLVVDGLADVSKLESIDGSAAKGDLALGTLNDATLNVTTGSGDDTFVLGNTATHAVTVSTGEGDDEVTLGAALVKGSSIDLGAGDDVLKLEFTQLNKDATVNGGESVVKKYVAMYEPEQMVQRAWRDAKRGKDVSQFGFVARTR